MARYWRVRSRCNDRDFSDETWRRGEAGIWYGAWTAQDFAAVRNRPVPQILAALRVIPAQQDLEWAQFKTVYVQTACRFANITSEDWVVMYVPGETAIGLGRLNGDMESNSDHPCNHLGELFKYRKIVEQKIFKLAELPDAYRLLSAQGRANIHEFRGMHRHVELLAGCSTSADLNEVVKKMSFEDMLDFFGDSAWESFCFAYLIMEEQFVPTGLSIGRTLKDVDIVGRNRSDGRRIIAQCKKNADEQRVEDSFLSAITSSDIAYYFAYGGVNGDVPQGIRVVGRREALDWSKSTKNGQFYRKLLLGMKI